MKKFSQDLIYAGFILLVSLCTVADLFLTPGKPENGDGLIHTLVPTLFANALAQGNFPVSWVSGFANYGLPLGTVSQQLTTYLSAFVIVLTHNPTLGFNAIVFLGILLSCLFFYLFLRLYFSPLAAFAGVFLFNFTPYRILNIYVRGALPEFFAEVFIPLLLIASYLIIVKRNAWGFFLFATSLALLTLTHPFMDVVGIILVGLYIVFLFITTSHITVKTIWKYLLWIAGSGFIGALLTAYYTLPLLLEIKYFYYSMTKNHLTPNNFLSLPNFFLYRYPYFTPLDISNRGFMVSVGVIESLLMLGGLGFFIYRLLSKKFKKQITLSDYAVITGIIFVFFLTSPSKFVYEHISFLSNIQFPWRMLTGFIFLPPILFATLINKFKHKLFAIMAFFVIMVFAFPQMYGKNYTQYPYSFYTFTPYNLDAVVMNTKWTELSNNYPITARPYRLIAGQGTVTSATITETKHVYTIDAKENLRLVDHTFYFPGWKAFIDNKSTTIEYQDQYFRGVITLNVPKGTHTVLLKYTDTKIRLLGKLLSMIGLVLFIFLIGIYYVTPLGKHVRFLSTSQR